jgi:hypothetical protein
MKVLIVLADLKRGLGGVERIFVYKFVNDIELRFFFL